MSHHIHQDGNNGHKQVARGDHQRQLDMTREERHS
jgi:hypothetical protein